jgi:hypothetical protein
MASSSVSASTQVEAPAPEQFDLDKFTEKAGRDLNGVANGLRTLTFKYVSFSSSASELAKEQDDKDKEAIGKLVQKHLRVKKMLEDVAGELEALNAKMSSFEC